MNRSVESRVQAHSIKVWRTKSYHVPSHSTNGIALFGLTQTAQATLAKLRRNILHAKHIVLYFKLLEEKVNGGIITFVHKITKFTLAEVFTKHLGIVVF